MTNVPTGWEAKDLIALLAVATGFASLIASSIISYFTLRTSRAATEASIWQKANENEISALKEQLTFYGQFTRISDFNGLLYRELRARQPDADRFLLIEKLFDRDWLSKLAPGDSAIVGELAANAREMRELILSSSSSASSAVNPYFARVAAHYRILELAYDGKLGTDPRPFVERYVFPKQIIRIVELEVARIQKRIATLMASPDRATAPAPDLAIPSELELKPWPDAPRAPRPELNMPEITARESVPLND